MEIRAIQGTLCASSPLLLLRIRMNRNQINYLLTIHEDEREEVSYALWIEFGLKEKRQGRSESH